MCWARAIPPASACRSAPPLAALPAPAPPPRRSKRNKENTMQQLEALVRDARDQVSPSEDRVLRNAGGPQPEFRVLALTGPEAEVARQMQICNACRYCEGFCAVFPAMTRRLEFGKADVNYLANLCHNCGACYHACQYAPPHEFAVNVPAAMAKVRVETYAEYAWPSFMGALYKRNGLTVSLALAIGLAL